MDIDHPHVSKFMVSACTNGNVFGSCGLDIFLDFRNPLWNCGQKSQVEREQRKLDRYVTIYSIEACIGQRQNAFVGNESHLATSPYTTMYCVETGRQYVNVLEEQKYDRTGAAESGIYAGEKS